jgi:MFS family permease
VSLRKQIEQLPGVYWTVWVGTLVNRMGGVVVPFLALYLTRDLKLSSGEAGLVVSLYGVGGVLAGFTGGVLTDRLGRRPTLLISLFGGAAALLLLGFARSLPVIGAATVLTGWLGDMYRPAVAALVADVVPPEKRVLAFGHLYWVVNLGFGLASALGGLASTASFTLLFVIDAVTMALYGLIVLVKVPETRPAEAQRASGPPAGIGQVLRDRVYLSFLLLTFAVGFVMWQNGTSIPLDMKARGISSATYGLLMGLNGLIIVLVQPRLTTWLQTRSKAWVMSVSSLVFGLGFGMFAVVSQWPGYAVAITIWTIGEIAHLPTSNAVVADLAPAAVRGRYQGLYIMMWGAASVVAPIAGGAILEGPGSRTLWVGVALLMCLVGAGHAVLGTHANGYRRPHP